MRRLALLLALVLVPTAAHAETWAFSLFNTPDVGPFGIPFDGDEGLVVNARVAIWVLLDRSSEPWTVDYIFLVDYQSYDWTAEFGHGIAVPFWQFPGHILGRVDYTVYRPDGAPQGDARWFVGRQLPD